MFSNTHDAAGDRATGRMTIAARTSPRGNRLLHRRRLRAVDRGSPLVALATGIVPSRLTRSRSRRCGRCRCYQLWRGVGRQRWLAARLPRLRVIRVGIVALVLANLLLPAVTT